MEYCPKSTLRDTIDRGLHRDQNRLWRLFREILDGLAYIHQQVCLHIWRPPSFKDDKPICFSVPYLEFFLTLIAVTLMEAMKPGLLIHHLLSFRAWYTGTWSLSTFSLTRRIMWRLETLAWPQTTQLMWYASNVKSQTTVMKMRTNVDKILFIFPRLQVCLK